MISKTESIRNNYYVMQMPFDLELEIDNTCNLSCRMCDADRSSRVERDPVHSQWSGRKYNLATWDDNILEIAPKRLLQAAYCGFVEVPSADKREALSFLEWCEITLLNLNQTVDTILLRVVSQLKKTKIRIFLNDKAVVLGELASNVSQEFKIPLGTYFDSFTLRFESDASRESYDPLLSPSVRIEKIELLRINAGARDKEFVFSRFQNKQHWMSEDEFVFGELLPRTTQLQQVKLVGGEPLINTDALRIVKYLASLDDPSKINVSFVTNGTIYNEEVFQIASKFKLMISAVSMDGVGHVNSYIRHGTNWESVIENVRKMVSSANVYVMVSCTLQAYNALVLGELFRFCDQLNLPCFAIVVTLPTFLSIDILPPFVRKVAAQRMRDYAESPDGNPVTKAQAAGLARQLELTGPPFDPQRLRDFMLFTNDLDRSRGESVHQALPELVQLIEDAGYPWENETKYS